MPKDSRKVAGGTGEKKERERQAFTAVKEKTQPEAMRLLEEVLRRENMLRALRRVRSNKGAPGIDGMTVEELVPYLKMEWPRIREELLKGTYQPAPVRQVEIPKPNGDGMRPLGIPTVLDRMIQQAILQVLTPIFDPHFSNSSYGFRPGRSCHDAVKAAQGYAGSGYRFVVDLDLEKFFDRVNHDVLMARVARRVKDKRLLRLLRKYLDSGYLDRSVDTLKHKGYRVAVSEIEAVLQEHPAVISACVVGVPDEKVGERIKAFAVLKEDVKGVSAYDLLKWCRERLASYKVPQYIEFRDMLPKSKVGKLLRRELRAEERKRFEK